MTPELTRLQNIVKRMDFILEKHEKRSDGYGVRRDMKELRDEIENAIKQEEARGTGR